MYQKEAEPNENIGRGTSYIGIHNSIKLFYIETETNILINIHYSIYLHGVIFIFKGFADRYDIFFYSSYWNYCVIWSKPEQKHQFKF